MRKLHSRCLVFVFSLMLQGMLLEPACALELNPIHFETLRGDHSKKDLGAMLSRPFEQLGHELDLLSANQAKAPKNCIELMKITEELEKRVSDKFELISMSRATADCWAISELSASQEGDSKNIPTIAEFHKTKNVDRNLYGFLKLDKPTFLKLGQVGENKIVFLEEYPKEAKKVPAGRSAVTFIALARVVPSDPNSKPFLLTLIEDSGAGATFSSCSLAWIVKEQGRLVTQKRLDLGRCG